MVRLQGVVRLGQPRWLLPAASAALNETAGQMELLRSCYTATARNYQTSAKSEASASAWSSWPQQRVIQLLGAGATLLAAAMLSPAPATAKKEIAILPGSKPPAPAMSTSKIHPPAEKPQPVVPAEEPAAPAASPSKDLRDDKGRPIYTREEVAKHKTPRDRIWVTYKEGVYDITEFVEMHPGGLSKIMLAAGGSVEPFWALYQQHRKPEVLGILEPYRIGTLEGGAAAAASAAAAAAVDPYASDPARHPSFIPRSERPYNGETPGTLLAASPITPNEIFFVRNHLPVPHVDAASYKLKVEGEGIRSLELSLEELKSRFRKHTVTATIQCSGNRRNEMSLVRHVKGLSWDQGAIGTAVWGGVRLRDVLKVGRLSEDDMHVRHIQFEGYDKDPASEEIYGASIPLHKALSLYDDVLLAYEMNGQPLSADHGAPLRVVVPGVTGARSVKWLRRIVPSSSESPSHWQQRDYKAFNPSVDWDSVEWGSAPALQEPPVTSAICEPAPGTSVSLADGEITLRGYAWSGGGRGIIRVDVSADGGKSWTAAKLLPPAPGAPPHGSYSGAWAWTLWEVSSAAAEGTSSPTLELVCKAVDSSYNNQPDSIGPIWNLRGIVNNAWHRVNVKLES
ncbi:hypothetical protein VOLCADRAFT_81306 [Volvox carteri f. nagariensis]|uniref:sulfite oxidase n=1 Tax=Volvox carteri f. nagariensis TaxID=3068 RepID=D8TX78_VOLCA|nr:uncharacterized protein VOLCADRAFT_81306 [Volvox carteri f. nagariensis]EFJ47861.1 hypothetical protein VOLCADRAFT_81306 [Volvox carteri f. nagariensis]|eukprot:XP_002950967.1 hypothetical protein VOLCADRAFT_81306 [Volvox carteri f. nagariensis]